MRGDPLTNPGIKADPAARREKTVDFIIREIEIWKEEEKRGEKECFPEQKAHGFYTFESSVERCKKINIEEL